jgi:hypothetical protein
VALPFSEAASHVLLLERGDQQFVLVLFLEGCVFAQSPLCNSPNSLHFLLSCVKLFSLLLNQFKMFGDIFPGSKNVGLVLLDKEV